MTIETIRPAVPFTADSLSRAVDEAARQMVNREVHYCVSALIATLTKAAYLNGDAAALIRSDIADDDTFAGLAIRSPDADDYRDAATDDIGIVRVSDGWHIIASEEDGGGVLHATALNAWRAAFDLAGEDHPDGAEVYEHWLVSEWFADKLEAHGETVARDVGGLTVWGRCTTGQAMYADHVVREIARDLHDLPRSVEA